MANYEGTVILVSHDRSFLDNVVTSTLAPLGDGRWIETSGGWSDLEGQGLSLITHKTQKSAQKKSPPPPNAPKLQTKLSYKDEYRLGELEKLMPALEAKIAKLEEDLSDPNLFTKSPDKFNKLSDELVSSKDKLEEMEIEWLELEDKKVTLNNTQSKI